MAQGDSDINGPHQGGWVTTAAGEDWFINFQDKGAYGRIIHLNPVNWRDDWPVTGHDNDGDGCGDPVAKWRKPALHPMTGASVKPHMLFQWHSNYNDMYGFPAPGALMRVYGHKVSEDFVNMWEVPNLWLMKFPAEKFSVTARVRISAKATSEEVSSGMVVMGWDYCRFGLEKRGDDFVLQLVRCTDAEQGGAESITDIALVSPTRVYNAGLYPNLECDMYLRLTVKKGASCRFSYSLDGKKYIDAPGEFKARAGKWIGAKTGFYSITPAATSEKGWIDIIDLDINTF